jgi:hypothetical protein
MPTALSPRPPKYRRLKATGQAIVTIAGRGFHLGKYSTAASQEQAHRRIASV